MGKKKKEEKEEEESSSSSSPPTSPTPVIEVSIDSCGGKDYTILLEISVLAHIRCAADNLDQWSPTFLLSWTPLRKLLVLLTPT